MRYSIQQKGDSASFPAGDKFLAGAAAQADVAIYLGAPLVADAAKTAIVVELGTECLAAHVDEAGPESKNVCPLRRMRRSPLQRPSSRRRA
jgi:3-hydroxybutyryl-CoA dehydrogenase